MFTFSLIKNGMGLLSFKRVSIHKAIVTTTNLQLIQGHGKHIFLDKCTVQSWL